VTKKPKTQNQKNKNQKKNQKPKTKNTTLNNGYLGFRNDEDRGKMR